MQVLNGPDGVFAGARKARSSPSPPPATRRRCMKSRAAAAKTEKNLGVIDTPLCRAERAAEEGKLLLLGGGDADLFDRCEPVFSTFCTDIEVLGKARRRPGRQDDQQSAALGLHLGQLRRAEAGRRHGRRHRKAASGPAQEQRPQLGAGDLAYPSRHALGGKGHDHRGARGRPLPSHHAALAAWSRKW